MYPIGSLRHPDEAFSVFQKQEVVVVIDPAAGIFLCENLVRCPGGRIGNQELQPVLITVEALHGQPPTVRKPLDSRDIDVVFLTDIHPDGFAPACGNDADLYDSIGIASLGISAFWFIPAIVLHSQWSIFRGLNTNCSSFSSGRITNSQIFVIKVD